MSLDQGSNVIKTDLIDWEGMKIAEKNIIDITRCCMCISTKPSIIENKQISNSILYADGGNFRIFIFWRAFQYD